MQATKTGTALYVSPLVTARAGMTSLNFALHHTLPVNARPSTSSNVVCITLTRKGLLAHWNAMNILIDLRSIVRGRQNHAPPRGQREREASLQCTVG